MTKEAKTAYILFSIAVMGYLLKYVLNVFLARHLSVAVYGDLQVALRILNILVGFTLFGTNVSSQRFLANYLRENKEAFAEDYIAWNMKLIGMTFVISFVVALIAIGLMTLLHVFHVKDINQYHLAVYMFWLAPFAAICVLLSSFLLSSNEVYFSAMLDQLKYGIEIILFIILVLLLDTTINNNTTIIGTLMLTFIILAVLGILLMDSGVLLTIKSALPKIWRMSVTQTAWFAPSRTFIANNVIFMVTCALDLLILGLIVPNKDDVGYYAAALTICGIIWVAPMNLYRRLKPKISSLIKSREGIIKLQSKLDKLNQIIISIIGVTSIVIIYFSTSLLSQFGTGYTAARVPLIILTLGNFVRGSTKSASLILVYSGFENLLLNQSIIEIILLCCLGSLATYLFGILGMAVVTSLVRVGGALFSLVFVRIKLGIRTALII